MKFFCSLVLLSPGRLLLLITSHTHTPHTLRLRMKLLALVLLLSAFSSLTFTEVMENLTEWKSSEKCGKFFIPNPKDQNDVIVPTVFPEGQYKMICQRWENKYRFATLYDTRSRIPVYSAYTYYQSSGNIKDNYWKIEPQVSLCV